MDTLGRWICVGTLLAAGAYAHAADNTLLSGHTVDGNLDEQARLQTVHAAMRRECGATPGSTRCQRLKREFRQEARNSQKRHRK